MQTGSSKSLIGWKSWKNHLCPSMGLNGGSVAMDSGSQNGDDYFLVSIKIYGTVRMQKRQPLYWPPHLTSSPPPRFKIPG